VNRSELRNSIRAWADREDWSDSLVDSWVEMARQNLSTRLRVADMVQIDQATINQNRVKLPDDWQYSDFVRVIDGPVLEYRDRQSFYKETHERPNYFTTSGLFMQLGGVYPDTGREVELHYFGDIPAVPEAESNWLTERFLEIILMRTLLFASVFGFEDERAVGFETLVQSRIEEANNAYLMSKTSGSVLVRKPKKGFR